MTNTRTRTRADRLGDGVSLAVLLALGGFAIAVSFSHTMDFVRAHGQTKDWIVVGTACTVVGLTIQSGMEVWRDRRDGRETGWPAALLTIGVLVELWANAAPAQGFMDKVVAAWPVPVAAAALHIWTRRLAAYAEAAAAVPEPVPAVPEPPRNGPEPVDEPREHPHDDEHQDELDERQDELVVDVAALPGETVKEKGAALLVLHPTLTAEQVAAVLGCSDRYARDIRREADQRPPKDEQVPGQLDGFEQIAAAAA